jgi:hypothetical protein
VKPEEAVEEKKEEEDLHNVSVAVTDLAMSKIGCRLPRFLRAGSSIRRKVVDNQTTKHANMQNLLSVKGFLLGLKRQASHRSDTNRGRSWEAGRGAGRAARPG